MNKDIEIFKCLVCGNITTLINGSASTFTCCGKNPHKLEANTTEASEEKHVPVYKKVDGELLVKVGSIEHPMTKEHYIMWVAQVSDNKINVVKLYPEQSTETFLPYIPGSTIYAYCNNHGLWKNIVK